MGGGPDEQRAIVPPLADREAVLRDLSSYLAAAWTSFDHPRPAEPEVDPELIERLGAPLPEEPGDPQAALGDAVARARRERLALAPALPGLHRLDRPRGRRAGLRARGRLRRQPRPPPRAPPTCSTARPCGGWPSSSASRCRGRFTSGGHDVEPHRAARRARARDPGRARATASRAPRRRSTAPTRRTTRSCAAVEVRAGQRARCAGCRSTRGGGCASTRSPPRSPRTAPPASRRSRSSPRPARR